jgi:type II secretory pathway predicted ATPase ExeA
MNESVFGLRQQPFPASPDLGCYYPASSHESALERLQGAIEDGEGMVLLLGAPGTGKTLLCHRLLDQMGESVESLCLTHTHFHDRAGLLQAILFDLSLPHAGRTEQEMRLALIDHLLKRFAEGKRTLLVIDEAQHLGPDLLEELRLLGNLEGGGGKAIQVVLVGQPDILATLSAPQLGSLRQRLAVRAALEPMGVEEAADYLLHHLRAAGGQAEQILGQEALELLARNTQGVPRLLDQAARQALRLAVSAGATEVDVEAAMEALARLGLPSELSGPADGAEATIEASAMESLPVLGEEKDATESSCRLFIAPCRSA